MLSDQELARFVEHRGLPLNAHQVSALGTFLRSSREAREDVYNAVEVPTTLNPFGSDEPPPSVLHDEPVDQAVAQPGPFRESPAPGTVPESLSGRRHPGESVAEHVKATIVRLQEVDAELSSTITFLDDRAAELAKESDRRIAAGAPRRLEGVPFTIKDVIDVAGARTTGGSRSRLSSPPARSSALVIARLERAGAIPVAKDSTTEFASGGMDTPLRGVCRNPWDPERWSGGSSSGTAVSVASRAVPFGIGTDVSGSVRMPAAFCGITGLKPTHGRLPLDGVIPMSWSNEVVGPMAVDARTVAAVFDVMCGIDTAGASPEEKGGVAGLSDADLGRFRIGIPRGSLFSACDMAVLDGLQSMAEQFGFLGATTTDVELPHAELAHQAAAEIVYPEAFTIHHPGFCDWNDLEAFTIDRLSRGSVVTTSEYLRAKQYGLLLRRELLALLSDVDALLIPTVPSSAPTIANSTMRINGKEVPSFVHQSRLAMICNLTGLPGLTVPAGFDATGCPVAATLITNPYREDVALHLAQAYQSHTVHHLRIPLFGEGRAIGNDGI